MDSIAVKSHFSASRLFFEKIFEPETAHQVLEEKIAYVQPGGRGSGIIRLFHPLIVISTNRVFYSADTIFLIHLPDLFLNIDQGIICDLKQFRMFPKPFDVSGSNFFPLRIPSWA